MDQYRKLRNLLLISALLNLGTILVIREDSQRAREQDKAAALQAVEQAEYDRCVTSNNSRRDIKDAFRYVTSLYEHKRNGETLSPASEKFLSDLEKELPQRKCKPPTSR